MHNNPWMPKASTIAPQGQSCGTNKFTPSLKPIATRTPSSSSLKPQDETGMAFNQSPLCGACAARRRALLMSSEHDLKKALQGMLYGSLIPRSLFDRTTGIWGWTAVFGWPNTSYTLHEPIRGWKFTGSKAAWVGRVAAAEAKKSWRC